LAILAGGHRGQRDRHGRFDRVIKIDPNNADAFNGRGNAYENKGERDKAIADFN
jgi:Flp pilus assembly protein TadD